MFSVCGRIDRVTMSMDNVLRGATCLHKKIPNIRAYKRRVWMQWIETYQCEERRVVANRFTRWRHKPDAAHDDLSPTMQRHVWVYYFIIGVLLASGRHRDGHVIRAVTRSEGCGGERANDEHGDRQNRVRHSPAVSVDDLIRQRVEDQRRYNTHA